MEIAIIVIGILLIVVGLAGSILPGLPGPPISYAALLLLFFIPEYQAELANNSYVWLIVLGVITGLITLVDYYMPIWGTKKFGGTPAGSRGSTIGLIVGAFLTFFTAGIGAIALLLGPAVGAYLGEKYEGKDNKTAIQSAKGSFLGFIAGTFMKVVVIIIIAIYFARVIL
ncbi:MAG: DUF456 domain-containing protein [Bacteroidia bacterium]|nr:DUF456 domain-containing protein [Bacteroidia bacterium]NNJ55260.1 DUF456 domain-containing protein [Bacteroidia bacterium]